MYEAYWNLERNPFEERSAAPTFFRSETHQAALLKLRYLIENRKGVGVLAGGTGLGKTALLHALGQELTESTGPFIHLVFPQMSAAELLAWLAVELGAAEFNAAQPTPGLDRSVRAIEQRLEQFREQGQHPTILVDEAHLIEDLQVFQALRLLLNFHQSGGYQFSLVFTGQNELLQTLHRLGQVADRLAVKCLLRPLTADETVGYVSSRLEAAGAPRPIFEPDALEELHTLSGGVPRRINRLCDLSLLVGYADELTTIGAEQIGAVAEELASIVPD